MHRPSVVFTLAFCVFLGCGSNATGSSAAHLDAGESSQADDASPDHGGTPDASRDGGAPDADRDGPSPDAADGAIPSTDAGSDSDGPISTNDAACTDCGSGCMDTTSDPMNCGGCGVVCSAPNATPACINSSCAIYECQGLYADCDGDPSNGCETLAANGVCPGSSCLANGAACAFDGNCCTHYCDDLVPGNSFCSHLCNDSGSPCTLDDECCSGFCDGATNQCQ
jgi:hypothetical protein